MEEDYIPLNQDQEDESVQNGVANKKKKENPFRNAHRKEEKEKRRIRKARIIIRNISYKATDETLQKHFEQFGKVVDLNLLKRPDGKLVGCAFIQYEKINDAAKAILQANNKEFLGRPVFVDWAVGKDQFLQKNVSEVKKESLETTEIKEEEEADTTNEEVKDEKITEEDEEKNDDEKDNDEDDDDDEADESGEEEEDGYSGHKTKVKTDPNKVKEKRISNDVSEGCTIFIKNVPFDASNEDLKKCCQKYGPVHYALINISESTGHSKGTAFVKFKRTESADMCLRAGDEFRLLDVVMEPFAALSREEMKERNESKSKNPSDSRNLYLVREGLIMANSKAADGVSAADMSKRHKLEQIKSQILKNLNRFVSRNRLAIHNLPLTYDDEKLRNMIVQFTALQPHECRVMRDKLPSQGYPNGRPKGFGFMSFKTHQEALTALRKLNNNPKVFGTMNRPIVSFSIEDRSVHNIKQKRLQKSKENNPTFKEKIEKIKEKKKLKRLKAKNTEKDDKQDIQQKINKPVRDNRPPASKKRRLHDDENTEEFVGTAAKPGTQMKLRSVRKLWQQSKDHAKKLSKLKRAQKQRKERIQNIKEKREMGVDKMKPKIKVEKDHFSNLVEKYKQSISTALESKLKAKRTKWYKE